MAKLELALLVGEQSRGFLASLTKQIDRLEALTTGAKKHAGVETADDTGPTPDDESEDYGQNKKALKTAATKKAAKSFEDDEDEEEKVESKPEADEDEEESFDKPAAKAAKSKKAKKVTREDVNAALKAYAKTTTFAKTKALLQKKFKIESVDDLEPEQYPEVIAAFAVDEEQNMNKFAVIFKNRKEAEKVLCAAADNLKLKVEYCENDRERSVYNNSGDLEEVSDSSGGTLDFEDAVFYTV